MKSILDWTATPLGTAVLGYVLLGICNFLFKPKSPEEYALVAGRGTTALGRFFWPRWAAFWQFLGGLLLDPAKVSEAFVKIVTGRVAPLSIGVVAAKPDEKKNDTESGPYRDGILGVLLVVGALSLPCTVSGCKDPATARTDAQLVLTTAQIACVFATTLTDSTAVADACGVTRDLLPVLRQLIGQREAAKRAGVRWDADAGSP